MSKSQKEAVYQAVVNVTGFTGEGACVPTKDERAKISMILQEGFKRGDISIESEFTDPELKNYVSGLMSNWLRKDIRLNGGSKYVAKNPGSRAGSSDASLKAMRQLLLTVTSEEDKAEIQTHIDARIAELGAAKVAKVVDFSALPADLAAKFGK